MTRRCCATSRACLEGAGFQCVEAADGIEGLEPVLAEPFDVILLDIDLPDLQGPEVLRRWRERPPGPHLKIIMFSGRASADEMAAMLGAGADGYLTKPLSSVQLVNEVKSAVRVKQLQRADRLNRNLLGMNAELERALDASASDLVRARNMLVLALAKLVKLRDGETGAHIWRLQKYCRRLAEEAAKLPCFAAIIDAGFIDLIECCVPLHDIGKVGIPDHILLKPGSSTAPRSRR